MTVVIVTYHSRAVVGDALRSIPAAVPVVVVDNASRDDTCWVVGSARPSAKVIANTRNRGFGAACNQGIAAAKTEFVLLLNPDAQLQDGALLRMIETARVWPDAAIVAPLIVKPDGAVQVTYRTSLFKRHESKRDFQAPEGAVCAEFLSGAVMLLRRVEVLGLGGFDEGLFFYYEDDDLCLKARAAGYGLVLEPAARVIHASGQGSGVSWRTQWRKQYHFTRSRGYMQWKYCGRWALLAWILEVAVVSLVKALAYAACGRFAKSWRHWGRLAGALSGFRLFLRVGRAGRLAGLSV